MKIAFIDQTGDVIGGAQESLALLLTHLPSDVEPLVVLFQEGAFAARLRAEGLPVEILPVSDAIATSTRDRVSLHGLAVIPLAIRRLARLLRDRRIDVVYTNTVKAHFIGGPAALLARRPCVAHLRDVLVGKSRYALRFVLRTFTKRQISISYSVARTYGLSDGTVIANPVDLTKYASLPHRARMRERFGLPGEDRVVFAIVGRINRWKGHDRFLRAAASSASTTSHFVIVGEPRFGDDDYVAELEALVRELGIGSRVSFLPWQTDLPALYAAIDVLVNCSKREPFGRTIIEAGAARVPSICLDDSGAGEFMKRANLEIVVPANDDDKLAAAMARFGEDHAARRAAGDAALVWAGGFDATTHAASVAAILRRACD